MLTPDALHGTAAENCPAEKAFCLLGNRECSAKLRARTLPHNGYIIRVSAERGNIFLCPPQSLHHIEKAAVPRLTVAVSQASGNIQESQRPQTVIAAYHRKAFLCKGFGPNAEHAGALHKGPSVNPEKDRCTAAALRHCHIQIQAVFIHFFVFCQLRQPCHGCLRRSMSRFSAVTYSFPRRKRHGRTKPQFSHRRAGIGNSQELQCISFFSSFHFSARCFDDHGSFFPRFSRSAKSPKVAAFGECKSVYGAPRPTQMIWNRKNFR